MKRLLVPFVNAVDSYCDMQRDRMCPLRPEFLSWHERFGSSPERQGTDVSPIQKVGEPLLSEINRPSE